MTFPWIPVLFNITILKYLITVLQTYTHERNTDHPVLNPIIFWVVIKFINCWAEEQKELHSDWEHQQKWTSRINTLPNRTGSMSSKLTQHIMCIKREGKKERRPSTISHTWQHLNDPSIWYSETLIQVNWCMPKLSYNDKVKSAFELFLQVNEASDNKN